MVEGNPMRVYLDNCTLNRPFDDQSQIRIRLEAEAKLHIQECILHGSLELAWSYVLDYENQANPFDERRSATEKWKARASVDVDASPELLAKARTLGGMGLRSKDALHLACAISTACDFFITTDDGILTKVAGLDGIHIVDPPGFVRSTEL